MNIYNFIFLTTVGVFFGFASIVLGCKSNAESQQAAQGIQGKVIYREGNLMPVIGGEPNKGKPVSREVHIYELTPTSKAVSEGAFFTRIGTKLIKKVTSNEMGEFKASLPPGKYSVFTKEKDGMYANLFDGQNNINPVEVVVGEYTEVNLSLDYNAAF